MKLLNTSASNLLISSWLFFFCFLFIHFAQGQTASGFEEKVNKFFKLYEPNFDYSKENLNGTGQYTVMENIKTSSWTKNITLKSKATIQDLNGKTAHLRLYFIFHQFDDTNSCTAAKDSILNCFGGDCTKIEWGAVDLSAKTIPCIYIFNDKEIICGYVSCEQKNDFWKRFKLDFANTFSKTGSKILETDCGGPITFREK